MREQPELIDEKDLYQGMPGYRNRPGRSGLDPLDTNAEYYHLMGVFIRKVFTRRLRTRDPLYLAMMVIFGVIPVTVLLILITLPNKSYFVVSLSTILFFGAYFVISFLLTLNFIVNMLEIFGVIKPPTQITPDHSDNPDNTHKETKSDKKRKDYR
jgi:hypothetical protein